MSSGGSIRGVVVAAGSNKPVASASVAPNSGFEGRPQVTNDRGRFELKAVGVGPRSITISHPDFGTTVQTVNVRSGTSVNVTLELDETADDKEVSMSGVGAVIDVQHGVLVVTGIVKGGAGLAAGLRVKDNILDVDGSSVSGLTLEEAADRIRGGPGTWVELRIERNGQEMTLSIERDLFKAMKPGRGTLS
jgi:hypothetical protein